MNSGESPTNGVESKGFKEFFFKMAVFQFFQHGTADALILRLESDDSSPHCKAAYPCETNSSRKFKQSFILKYWIGRKSDKETSAQARVFLT